jgi:hypothetical protein
LLQGQGADLADLESTLSKTDIVFEHTQQNSQETLEDGSQVCESAPSAPGKGFGAALSDECADLEVCTPCSQPTQLAATPDDELKIWEACCQTKPYPNPKSDNVRSSQKRALAIRQAYRAARTKEDLSALRRENGGEFSQDELTWVYNWLKIFFKAEFSHVQMTTKISQPGLL